MTSRQPIAVLGATGNQGGHVARALLEAGRPVRAITRHPESRRAKALATLGAQVIEADMGEVCTLIRAFDGAYGIFSVQNFWELGLREEVSLGTNVIEAAQAVGNPHVVYSSGLGAERRRGVAAIDGKAILEKRLVESGMPFTTLRPALFMDDFLGTSLPFARPIQKALRSHRSFVGRLFIATLRAVLPQDARVPLTTLDDVGRMTAWALENPSLSQDQAHPVVGSIESPAAICTLWETARGESIPYVPGLRQGIHLFHPRMAKLLEWIGTYQDVRPNDKPLLFETYAEWLLSNHPSGERQILKLK